jgi:hypothetical protein
MISRFRSLRRHLTVDLIAGSISVSAKSVAVLPHMTGWSRAGLRKSVESKEAGADVDVKRGGLEKGREGGFQGCNTGGLAS